MITQQHGIVLNCFEQIILFSNINNQELLQTNQVKKIKFKVITIKHTSNKNSFIDQINIIHDHNCDLNCNKYFELKELTNLAIDYTKCLLLLHFNISSLPFHSDEFSILLTENRLHSDILGISESHLKSNKIPITSTHLPEYNIGHKGSKSGILLYIKMVSIRN